MHLFYLWALSLFIRHACDTVDLFYSQNLSGLIRYTCLRYSGPILLPGPHKGPWLQKIMAEAPYSLHKTLPNTYQFLLYIFLSSKSSYLYKSYRPCFLLTSGNFLAGRTKPSGPPCQLEVRPYPKYGYWHGGPVERLSTQTLTRPDY